MQTVSFGSQFGPSNQSQAQAPNLVAKMSSAAPETRFGTGRGAGNNLQPYTFTRFLTDGIPRMLAPAIGEIVGYPVRTWLNSGKHADKLAQQANEHLLKGELLEKKRALKIDLLNFAADKKLTEYLQAGAIATTVLLAGTLFATRGMAWYNAKRLAQQAEGAFKIIKSHQEPIIGHTEVKERMNEMAALMKLNGPYDNKLMMYGPPGTGKTALAGSLADSLGATLINVDCELLAGKPGSVQMLRDFINQQNSTKPTVVLMDEFDSVASREELGAGSEGAKTINALLKLMEGAEGLKNNKIIWIAATNHSGAISKALKDRFRNKVTLQPPSRNELKEIFKLNLDRQNILIPENFSFETVLDTATGVTGRSVRNAALNMKDSLIAKNLPDLLKLQAEKKALSDAEKPHYWYTPLIFWKNAETVSEEIKTALKFKVTNPEPYLLQALQQVKEDAKSA
jgi:hypothetical protein